MAGPGDKTHKNRAKQNSAGAVNSLHPLVPVDGPKIKNSKADKLGKITKGSTKGKTQDTQRGVIDEIKTRRNTDDKRNNGNLEWSTSVVESIKRPDKNLDYCLASNSGHKEGQSSGGNERGTPGELFG